VPTQKLKDAAGALNVPQVIKASEMFIALINEQHLILDLQSKFAKPADVSPLHKLRDEHSTEAQRIKQKDMKAPPTHIGLVADSMQLFCACLIEES